MPDPATHPKEEGGKLTAAVAWGILVLFVGPNAHAALSLFWHFAVRRYEDISYTLDRWGVRRIVPTMLTIVAITILARYTAVHPSLRGGTSVPFWVCTAIIVVLALYIWLAVRPVTSVDRDAARKPYDDARKRVEEVQKGVDAKTMTGNDLTVAQALESRERENFRRWEKRAGTLWIGFFQVCFITWLCLVIEGFSYFFHGEEAYHTTFPKLADVLTNRNRAANEFWFGALCYAGPLWFLALYGAPKWIIGPIARLASKAERAIVRAMQNGEAALIDGVVTHDIEVRDLALDAKYGNTYRTAVDVLRNEIEHPFFGVMIGSGLQLLVARRTMYFAVTIDTAVAGIVLLIIETAVVNRLTDQVPVVHDRPHWSKALSVVPMIPSLYGLIVGGDGNGVVSPLYYWQGITEGFESAGDTVALAGEQAAGPTGHYVSLLGGMNIYGGIAFTVLVFVVAAVLRYFWLPLSEGLEKIKSPVLRSLVLVIGGLLGLWLSFALCAQVFHAPMYLPQAGQAAGAQGADAATAYNALCHVDGVSGQFDCTIDCFVSHVPPLATDAANMAAAEANGTCRRVSP